MRIAKLFAALALVVAANAVIAQPMPAPPAELKKLDFMLGTWSGTVKWSMTGMSGSSKMTMASSYEGQFIKTIATTEMPGMTMHETSYTGWDSKKKKYSTHTFTDFAPTPRIEWGTFSGDKFVSLSEPWDVGIPTGPVEGRATLTKQDGGVLFVLEFKEGKKWVKAASGWFTKVE